MTATAGVNLLRGPGDIYNKAPHQTKTLALVKFYIRLHLEYIQTDVL